MAFVWVGVWERFQRKDGVYTGVWKRSGILIVESGGAVYHREHSRQKEEHNRKKYRGMKVWGLFLQRWEIWLEIFLKNGTLASPFWSRLFLPPSLSFSPIIVHLVLFQGGWTLLRYLENNLIVHINGIIRDILFMWMRTEISHTLINNILEWMVGQCFSGWKYPLAWPRPLRPVWLWKCHQQISESTNWGSQCSRRWD